MNCLIDYIGLTGCGASSPASGLFINSLPGISLKSIEQLADSEQQTYVGVWNDVQTRAIKRLELNLNSLLSKNYKVLRGKYSINTQPESLSSTTASFSAPTFRLETRCFSPLGYHHIEAITVRKVNPNSTITVTVLDVDDNSILYNKLFATNGESTQTVSVVEDFYQPEIYVKVTVSGNLFYQDEAEPIYFSGGNIKYGVHNAGTFTESNYSYGLNLNYGLRCSLTNLTCHSKDLFSLPLWYLLGSELMMERMVSERINKWTVDRKQAEELKAFYDGEFEKALKAAVDGICINDCDCCIECDPPISIKEARL